MYQRNITKNIKKDYEKAGERYQNLSKEEKEKKQQYGRDGYKNVSEDKKQKLVEYKKILYNEGKLFMIIGFYLKNFSDKECNDVLNL